MEEKDIYDVIIIGAGPAGLACAAELGGKGKRILVLEKNKEIGPKVCAGGVTKKVEEFGYPLSAMDRTFTSFSMYGAGSSISVPFKEPIAATIDRKRLGVLMFNALPHDVEVRTGVAVTAIGDGYISAGGKQYYYNYLVGADGGMSLVRKYVGLPSTKIMITVSCRVPLVEGKDKLGLYFDSELFGYGYGWLFPHKEFISLGCGLLSTSGITGQFPLKERFFMWAKKLGFDIGDATIEGGIISYDYRGHDFENIFLAGDAGGFVSGLTGEGIYYAMVSGRDIARKILDPAYNYKEIKYILKKKRKQEYIAMIAQLCYRTGGVFLLNNFLRSVFFLMKRWDGFAKKIYEIVIY
jgi:geranylgeranyl reductase